MKRQLPAWQSFDFQRGFDFQRWKGWLLLHVR